MRIKRDAFLLLAAAIFLTIFCFSTINALPTNYSASFLDVNYFSPVTSMNYISSSIAKIGFNSGGGLWYRVSCNESSWFKNNIGPNIYFNWTDGNYGCNNTDGNAYVYVQYSDNNTAWTSSVKLVAYRDRKPPTNPTNLKIIKGIAKYGTFTLVWDPSSDAEAGFKEYRVYESFDPREARAYFLKKITTVSQAGIDPKEYEKAYYAVTSVDNAGNETQKQKIEYIKDVTAPYAGITFLNGKVTYEGEIKNTFVTVGKAEIEINFLEPINEQASKAAIEFANGEKKEFAITGIVENLFKFSFDVFDTYLGDANITVEAVDLSGNKTTKTEKFTIVRETLKIEVLSPTGRELEGIVPFAVRSDDASKAEFYVRRVGDSDWKLIGATYTRDANRLFSFDWDSKKGLSDLNFFSGNYELRVVVENPQRSTKSYILTAFIAVKGAEELSLRKQISEAEDLGKQVEDKIMELSKTYIIPEGITSKSIAAENTLGEAVSAYALGNIIEAQNKAASAKAMFEELQREIETTNFIAAQVEISFVDFFSNPIFLANIATAIVILIIAAGVYAKERQERTKPKKPEKVSKKAEDLLRRFERERREFKE